MCTICIYVYGALMVKTQCGVLSSFSLSTLLPKTFFLLIKFDLLVIAAEFNDLLLDSHFIHSGYLPEI